MSNFALVRAGQRSLAPANEVWAMPPTIAQAGPKASARVIDFFAGQLRNQNTRAAYIRAISEFLNCTQDRGFTLDKISP